MPEEVAFRTKPEIALEQLGGACERDVPRGIVLADSSYGDSLAFREGCEALGLSYVVGVKGATMLWPPGVEPVAPQRRGGRGRPARRWRLPEGYEPISLERLAAELPSGSWRTITWREGSNAALASRFARRRVRVAHADRRSSAEPPTEQWLLIEWPEGESAPTKFWLATLAASTSLAALVHTAKMRWRIERDYQELKGEFGLNHYEGRNWRGFHHHASLCIAAYAFLVIERLKHPGRKKKWRPREEPALPEGYVPRGAGANAATC